jgi:acetolactate synthase-1/2/3 large subunit
MISWKMDTEFGHHFGTDFPTPDLVTIAEGLGCHARRIDLAEEFRPALKDAFAHTGRPSVIVVPVDYRENAMLTRRLGEVIAR